LTSRLTAIVIFVVMVHIETFLWLRIMFYKILLEKKFDFIWNLFFETNYLSVFSCIQNPLSMVKQSTNDIHQWIIDSILFSLHSSFLISRYSKRFDTMFKTILRQTCRLRPAFNMRLTTSFNHQLHTLSASSSKIHRNNQVILKHPLFFFLLIISFRFGLTYLYHVERQYSIKMLKMPVKCEHLHHWHQKISNPVCYVFVMNTTKFKKQIKIKYRSIFALGKLMIHVAVCLSFRLHWQLILWMILVLTVSIMLKLLLL